MATRVPGMELILTIGLIVVIVLALAGFLFWVMDTLWPVR